MTVRSIIRWKQTMTNGPFAQASAQISAYYLVDCATPSVLRRSLHVSSTPTFPQ